MLSVQVWHWQIEDSRCWLSYFRWGGVRGEEAMSCIFSHPPSNREPVRAAREEGMWVGAASWR